MIRLIFIFTIILTFNLIAQVDSIVTYYNNGNLKSVVHLRDDVRDGEAIFYWEDGNLKEILNYSNGRVEGLVRVYNENGVLKEMFTIEGGKREGPTSLLDSTATYINDIYYEEGILVVD